MEVFAVFWQNLSYFLPFVAFWRVVAAAVEPNLVQVGAEVFVVVSEDLLNGDLLREMNDKLMLLIILVLAVAVRYHQVVII